MRAIDFEQANKIYGKPESMTDEECYPVSAYEHKNDKGEVECINTLWQPNADYIIAINSGRPIVMNMRASFLVPHALFTFDENGNTNEL